MLCPLFLGCPLLICFKLQALHYYQIFLILRPLCHSEPPLLSCNKSEQFVTPCKGTLSTFPGQISCNLHFISPILQSAGNRGCLPCIVGLWFIRICSRWNLFPIHEIPIRLHTVLIVCSRFFLAQQFHIADLLLEHLHEISSVTQPHHSSFRR